jgi:4-hydroxybenzoate polyprenyltransferase
MNGVRTLGVDTAGFFFTNRFHIVLMPVFLTLFWNQALRLPLPPEYYLMIALTTAGGYIYNFHTDGAEDALNYRRQYRLFMPGSWETRLAIVVCFVGGLLLSVPAGWPFVLYGGAVHFLGGLYSRPLPLRWRGRPLRIKEVPFLKNIYAGLFWSVALILTPHLYVGAEIGAVAGVVVLLSFGMNYFVELMWDVRDMRGDAAAGFRTVPLVIGEPATAWLLRIVHLATCGLMAWGASSGVLPPGCWVVAGVHAPLGLLFLEYYRGLPDKDWASHVYILYGGALVTAGMLTTWTLQQRGG